MVSLKGDKGVTDFVKRAAKHRVWEREPKVRHIP